MWKLAISSPNNFYSREHVRYPLLSPPRFVFRIHTADRNVARIIKNPELTKPGNVPSIRVRRARDSAPNNVSSCTSKRTTIIKSQRDVNARRVATSRRRGAAYPRDWSLGDGGGASSREVRHVENNSGTLRTRAGEFFVRAPPSYVLTAARDAIFMEPRELRLRIFHLPRVPPSLHRGRALIVRHLPSSAMASDDFRETYRSAVVYERPETRDRRDRSVPWGSSRKKPAREEGRNSAPLRALMNHTPRCLRSTE